MNKPDNFIKHIIALATGVGLLLLIPFIAMKFTDEVAWTLSDFVVAGALLFGTGFIYLLLSRKAENLYYRSGVGLGLASGLFLIWANLAVGLIGSEAQPANLMYFGVIATGLIGAFLSRFQAKGMVYTMFTMAAAMVVITVIALTTGMQHYPASSVTEILGVNAFFMVPFILSGILFHHAAGEMPADPVTQKQS